VARPIASRSEVASEFRGLHVRRQTLASRSREGQTSAGEVEFLYEVVNQDGVVAMTQRSWLLLKHRPQPFGN